VPYILENEPRSEYDWPLFNKRLREEYLSTGDDPFDIELPEIPSILMQ